MTRVLIFSFITTFVSCQPSSDRSSSTSSNLDTLATENNTHENKKEPCKPPYWTATGKKLRQERLNDSTEHLYLNDTLWFTIEREKKYDSNRNIAYLTFYGRTGLLEEEGLGLYFEHPMVDFSEHGEWKRYDCNGELISIKTD